MTEAKADSTAVRVALWRALHREVDAPPPVLDDTLALDLADPEPNWRERMDMHPQYTRTFRAAIVARARFIEELAVAQTAHGVTQYVLLGAGLDSFAQRRANLAEHLTVFEIDKPSAQAWKRQRLEALRLGVPDHLKLVPVDFEAHQSWLEELQGAGFDTTRPALVASTGVSLYLTREANAATLREVAALAPGSTFAMTFILPLEMCDPEERPGFEAAIRGARASGTPFVSFFTPEEMLAMARDAGFKRSRIVTGADLAARYFVGRSDGLRPGNSETLLVAAT